MTDTLDLEMRFNDKLRQFVKETPLYCCPITKLVINTESANEWLKPTNFNGEIMSWLGRSILESKITAVELMTAAQVLVERNR